MPRVQSFGPYELHERIGVGAMGEVFRAIGRGDGRLVALKRLMPFVGADADVVDALYGEANLARALDHPSVAKVYDVGDVGGVHYIAYEYVHGRDLRNIRERAVKGGASIPVDVGIFVVAQIALALGHAHGRRNPQGAPLGLVHRDVCPSNILVAFDGSVKLSDFGIARAEGRAGKTEAGEVKGTIGYMSPEQVCGEPIDGRSDIYSLGVCLWELATGQRLFDAAPALVIMERIAKGEVPRPRDKRPDVVSPALEAVILKALAHRRDTRYSSAEDLHADLVRVARAEGRLADSTRVAQYVRSLFPEVAAEEAASRQELLNMAESKGGSDLDVFEGLAKKSQRPGAPGLTPPPPSARGRTLIGGLVGGMPLPPPPGPSTAAAPLPAVPSATPPPPAVSSGLPPPPPSMPKPSGALPPPPGAPPQRTSSASLPPVSAPPQKSSPQGSAAALPPPTSRPPTPATGGPFEPTPSVRQPLPPPSMPKPGAAATPLPPPPGTASAAPAPAPAGSPPPASLGTQLGVEPGGKKKAEKSVDMDWDDEEESTHVYDKATHDLPKVGVRPAAGTPAAPKVSASAAALLASSGGAARAPSLQTPIPAAPTTLPAPAPVPSGMPAGVPVPSAPPAPVAAIAPMPVPARDEPTAVRARPAPAAGGSKAGVVLGALALVAVLALAAFMLIPRSGVFKIDVKSKSGAPIAKVEIFIDGQKKCDTAPCVVADLSPGPKTIKVIAPDAPMADPVTETVEANKEKMVFITIEAGGATPTSTNVAATTAGGTGVKAVGGQPNVKVLVDGADKGLLPVELKDLAAGNHKVRFEGPGYEPQEQTVEVVAGQMKDLGAIKLKVLKGTLTLELATGGSSVTLMALTGKKDKKTLDSVLKVGTPIKLGDIDATQTYKLIASKKGFTSYAQDVSFEDGMPDKSFRIELFEEGKTPPPVAAVPGPAPGPGPKETPKETPKEAPAATGSGTLNMNSIPVSKVVLDGRPLGSTPKVGVSVPAGTHTVTFILDDKKQSVSVTVKAGETKTAAVKFK